MRTLRGNQALLIRTLVCCLALVAALPLHGLAISGAILVDQVRSIDRVSRRLRITGHVPEAVVADVQAKLAALFGISA